MLTLHVNLWPGDAPDPRTTFPRATRRPPGMARPRASPRPNAGAARSACARDQPGVPASPTRSGSAPAGPPPGRAEAVPPTGTFWMGSVPPSFRPGWGGDSTPAGGLGQSPSRRPGGPAPKRWQGRPRRSPVTPADRWTPTPQGPTDDTRHDANASRSPMPPVKGYLRAGCRSSRQTSTWSKSMSSWRIVAR